MQHSPVYDHASHLTVLRPVEWADTVEKLVFVLTPLRDQFDAIAVRGMSGLLLVAAVASQLNRTMIAVRKTSEVEKRECHSYNMCEGDRGARSYVIIDDFIDTGATAREIYDRILVWAPSAKCIGLMPYFWLRWQEESCHAKGLKLALGDTSEPKLKTDWMPVDEHD